MREVDFLIIGGGPAGLSAAITSTKYGVDTVLLDDGLKLGGQLTKQTHKFFGSKMERAGTRGFVIGEQMVEELESRNKFSSYINTNVTGFYEDGVITAIKSEKDWLKFKPKRILIATGASEKLIAFPGNDLPGVYGAGAVQTLMNLYGVIPGKRVLMIGAGNIGLIISYQLLQAGVNVAAVVEAMDHIGGYWVHASKIRRLGIPILTRYTILKALGEDKVEGAIIAKVDDNWKPISGSEVEVPVDTICLAVGLSPIIELLMIAGANMKYVPELGGDVPIRNEFLETSISGVYVAGDAAGIEEASSAMLEGNIVGMAVSKSLGIEIPGFEDKIGVIRTELDLLRAGPLSVKVRDGLEKVIIPGIS